MDEITVAWIAGIILSTIGWGSFVHFAWIVRNWPKARGRVVDNSAEWSKGHTANGVAKHTVYFPMILFDALGVMHTAKGGIGQTKPWTIGEPIELYFNPKNPNHLLDLNWWQRLIFSGAFALFGGLSLAAAMGWVS